MLWRPKGRIRTPRKTEGLILSEITTKYFIKSNKRVKDFYFLPVSLGVCTKIFDLLRCTAMSKVSLGQTKGIKNVSVSAFAGLPWKTTAGFANSLSRHSKTLTRLRLGLESSTQDLPVVGVRGFGKEDWCFLLGWHTQSVHLNHGWVWREKLDKSSKYQITSESRAIYCSSRQGLTQKYTGIWDPPAKKKKIKPPCR